MCDIYQAYVDRLCGRLQWGMPTEDIKWMYWFVLGDDLILYGYLNALHQLGLDKQEE